MRYSILASLALVSTIILLPADGYSADPRPIDRTMENSDIMARVQLVGVIAGGATKNSGIAVIKDSNTGRTYAIKSGDSLPGVPQITLISVRRGEAVFNGANKEYLVRTTNISAVQDSKDNADISDETAKDVGTGLLSHWYESRITPDKASTNQTYLTPSQLPPDPREQPTGPKVIGMKVVTPSEKNEPLPPAQNSGTSNYLNDINALTGNKPNDRETSKMTETTGSYNNDMEQTVESDDLQYVDEADD